ncbi:Crp/Fnr family transcriptional regulator [Tenacibaculum sp. E3R01]|uniref:Crp/Fnr family transcriptional regulator n=1 Tax=unclassified Tenacibaculum TaxID=2635139 RepID=UPI0008942255|nr:MULTISPECIES: Crp/Fnr family transcriptional regulator [unclassified Tenacibaculum]RBW63183.1 Crp/Fnr family transcriptional regulator [Tenacibaculum sp. E3R01]SEE43863.1 CRP/FNR family transcriptional regulator, anaerobic regulatory protein [Tenacibaculum sp. MAR_2010_89]
MKTSFLAKCFPVLEKELLNEVEEHSILKSFKAGDFVVKQGRLIRFLPIVLSGNIKVFSNEDSIQFLLYYISSGETCIYSFAHISSKELAGFSAIAELDSELLLLPIDKVNKWLKKYPSFGNLVLSDYKRHYKDLLNTTKQVLCYNLEERLLNYLKNKVQIKASNVLSVSHQEVADDLGTSREVITRLLKKLSIANKVLQEGRKIKVL